MINPGEMGWVPENEELIKVLAQQLGRSAYDSVDLILNNDIEINKKSYEDMYVSALLISRLGHDPLIKVVLNGNAKMLSNARLLSGVKPIVTPEEITTITQELLRKLLNHYNTRCKEGILPDQLKTIPPFDFRSKD